MAQCLPGGAYECAFEFLSKKLRSHAYISGRRHGRFDEISEPFRWKVSHCYGATLLASVRLKIHLFN